MQPLAKGEREIRPQKGKPPAGFIHVPTAASAVQPHCGGALPIELLNVLSLRFCRNIEYGVTPHPVCLVLLKRERTENIGDLGLDHVDRRVVTEAGIRSVNHEKVRKAGDGGRRERFHPMTPSFCERHSPSSVNPGGKRRLRRFESGGQDQHIKVVSIAARGDNTGPVDPGEGGRFQRHGGSNQRGVIVAGEGDAFAPNLIRRGQLVAKGGIRHLIVKVSESELAEAINESGAFQPLRKTLFCLPEEFVSQLLAFAGMIQKSLYIEIGICEIRARNNVRCTALEQHHAARVRHYRRCQLHRGGPATDDSDTCASERPCISELLWPSRGVKCVTRE